MVGHHKNTCPLWGQKKNFKAKGSKKKECAQKTNRSVRTVALSLHGILC